MSGANILDVACVQYYKTIREHAVPQSDQIGFGINMQPPLPGIRDWVVQICTAVVQRHACDYAAGDAWSPKVTETLASLLRSVLGKPINAEDIFLFNGATEAISTLTRFYSTIALKPVLPLPNYYVFDQALKQSRSAHPRYYAARSGRSIEVGVDEWAAVVAPNGVNGQIPAARWATAGSVFVDVPFTLPALVEGASERLFDLIYKTALDQGAISLTASKDLSLPGLRCSLVVTTDSRLQAYLSASRFVQNYAVSSIVGPVMAAYVALLAWRRASLNEQHALLAEIRRLFKRCALPEPQETTFTAADAAIQKRRSRYLANMEAAMSCPVFDSSDLSLPEVGYSALMPLAVEVEDQGVMTEWVKQHGKNRLKLNPQYLFGGTAADWGALYPGQFALRINLSVEPDQLAHCLRRLCESQCEDAQ